MLPRSMSERINAHTWHPGQRVIFAPRPDDISLAELLASRRGSVLSPAFFRAAWDLMLRRGTVDAALIRDQATPRAYFSAAELIADGKEDLANELAWHHAKDTTTNQDGLSCFNMPVIDAYGIADVLEVVIAHELLHAIHPGDAADLMLELRELQKAIKKIAKKEIALKNRSDRKSVV